MHYNTIDFHGSYEKIKPLMSVKDQTKKSRRKHKQHNRAYRSV